MSRTLLAMLACVFALLNACQPNQPTSSPTPDLGTTEEQNDGLAKGAARGMSGLPVASTNSPETAAVRAMTPDPVDIEEIIELEFGGDDDFDMELHREVNPFPAETVLLAEAVRQRGHEFRMVDVQAYERLTKDSGEARRVAAEFLNKAKLAVLHDSAEELQESQSLGERAIELGSTDPLVRAELDASRIRTTDLDNDTALIKAIAELGTAGYRPAAQFIYHYHVVLFNAQQGTLTPHHGAELRQYSVAWLKSEKLDDDFLRIAWNWLAMACGGAEALGMEEAKRFVDACLEVPNLDPWLKHMLAGRYYKSLAWNYRGGGWASEVTEEGGLKFGTFLPVAGRFFTRAWQLRPEFPEAATEMIGVSMAGGDSRYSPRGWFDCAIRAQFDSYAAYVSLHNALQPRWSGDPTVLPRFIKEVMETERFDTEVPYWGLSLLRRNDSYIGRGREIWHDSGSYETVRKMIQGYLAYEDPAVSVNTLRSQLAAAASYTKDYATARDAFADLSDEQVAHEPFDEVKLNAPEARYFASVMAGPAAQKLAELDWSRAESEYLQKDDLDVFETALGALRELDPAPASQVYWNRLERPIAWRKAYLTGEWVNLTFEKGIPGWSVSGAEYEVENANSVAITSTSWRATSSGSTPSRAALLGNAPPIELACKLPVEPPYVVELDIENIPASDRFNRLGVVIGRPLPFEEGGKYLWFDEGGKYLWLDPSRQRIGSSVTARENEGTEFDFKEDRTHVRIHVWDNAYERFLNEIRVDDGKGDGLGGRGQLGFGTVLQPGGPYSVRFSNVRVRQLSLDPPGAGDTASEGL